MNKEKFYSTIKKTLFRGKLTQSQVDGIEGVLTAMDEVGDGDKDTLAYCLATDYHETGARMVPVREGFATTDAGARRAVNALAKKRGPNSAVAKYALPAGPYGHVYYGRGHTQLTWLENYQKASKYAGVDLVKEPDLMLNPVISARVLILGIINGTWSGKRKGISYYEGEDDFLSLEEAKLARQTVNGSDKASLIAGYHKAFYDALTEAGWQPKTKSSPKKTVAVAGGAAAVTLWVVLQEQVEAFFTWLTSFIPW